MIYWGFVVKILCGVKQYHFAYGSLLNVPRESFPALCIYHSEKRVNFSGYAGKFFSDRFILSGRCAGMLDKLYCFPYNDFRYKGTAFFNCITCLLWYWWLNGYGTCDKRGEQLAHYGAAGK